MLIIVQIDPTGILLTILLFDQAADLPSSRDTIWSDNRNR